MLPGTGEVPAAKLGDSRGASAFALGEGEPNERGGLAAGNL